MKIKEIRALPLLETPAPYCGERGADIGGMQTLVEVVTDGGIHGLGSVYSAPKLVAASLDILSRLLIGESATEPARVTENLFQHTIWEGTSGPVIHTISGINIALWDIFGKTTSLSIGRLFGGRYRSKIKAYASILMCEPAYMPARLEASLKRGFKAVKIGWGPFGRSSRSLDEAIIRVARETLGPNIDLMVDAGGSDAYWPHGYKWALETARMLRDYDVIWFEEPLRPGDLNGYMRLTATAPIPIAGCEVLSRRQSFYPWIENRAVDVVQPDVTKVGGINEAVRIAAYAHDNSIVFAPHGWNTAVGLAADLQVAATTPSAQWVEYITPSTFIDDLVADPFRLDGEGMLTIPDRPGLGVDWNPDGIQRHTGLSLSDSDI